MAARLAIRPERNYQCNSCGASEGTIEKVRVVNGLGGTAWVIGWLFTIGYLKLGFWPGALALLIWPYNIGVAIAGLHH